MPSGCGWYFSRFSCCFGITPSSTTSTRYATVGVLGVIIVGSIVFSWKRRALRWTLLALYAVIAVFLFMPSSPREGDAAALRSIYSKSMAGYTGVAYAWGGECATGIDCSGLVRRGLFDAFVSHGIRTFNPYWVREGISIWWNDATAEMLGKGAGGRTREITNCKTLNELDPAQLQPGDLAVTLSGIHVMAYLGNNVWIGADPGEQRVTQFTVPENKNGYFATPMRIVKMDGAGSEVRRRVLLQRQISMHPASADDVGLVGLFRLQNSASAVFPEDDKTAFSERFVRKFGKIVGRASSCLRREQCLPGRLRSQQTP